MRETKIQLKQSLQTQSFKEPLCILIAMWNRSIFMVQIVMYVVKMCVLTFAGINV